MRWTQTQFGGHNQPWRWEHLHRSHRSHRWRCLTVLHTDLSPSWIFQVSFHAWCGMFNFPSTSAVIDPLLLALVHFETTLSSRISLLSPTSSSFLQKWEVSECQTSVSESTPRWGGGAGRGSRLYVTCFQWISGLILLGFLCQMVSEKLESADIDSLGTGTWGGATLVWSKYKCMVG